MPEQRIDAGAAHVFPAEILDDRLDLQNRHGVAGDIQYQIGAQPAVTVPIADNGEYEIRNIRGLQLTVTNNLPNSLYCVY